MRFYHIVKNSREILEADTGSVLLKKDILKKFANFTGKHL